MSNNSRSLIPEEIIMDKIYLIREMKVMLDYDLSEMYGVETRVLKQAVRRNKRLFPADFMIELTTVEHDALKKRFGTRRRGRHSKYPPFALCSAPEAIMVKSVVIDPICEAYSILPRRL